MSSFRRTGTTSAAALSGLVVTLGLTHATAPEWARRAGLDVWNIAEAVDSLRTTEEESARLSEEAQRLHETIEATDHITTRLVTGEISLGVATDQIEPLMRERQGFGLVDLASSSAPSFRVKVARYLIDRTRRSLADDPGRIAGTEARLNAEFHELVRLSLERHW
jgi:hypothetical protein